MSETDDFDPDVVDEHGHFIGRASSFAEWDRLRDEERARLVEAPAADARPGGLRLLGGPPPAGDKTSP